MGSIIEKIKISISLFLGFLCYLLGDFNEILKFLMFFISVDIITGFIKGLLSKSGLNSRKMFIGGYRKALIFLIIMIGNIIDMTFTGLFLRESIIIYYIIQEWISIIENIGNYIELPDKLVKFFEQLQEEENNNDKTIK